jgi:hypothetical protein
MAMFPQARTEGVVAIEVGDILILQDEAGRELGRLDRFGALVWRLADGRTPVGGIARAAAVETGRAADNEAVWSVLDRLADFGLLAQRLTPPAGGAPMPRRGVLGLAAGGATGAAAAAGTPRPAQASRHEEQIQKSAEAQHKRNQMQAEQRAKFQNRAQEQNTKASQRGEAEAKRGQREESQRKQAQCQESGAKQTQQESNNKAFQRAMAQRQRDQELGGKEASSKRNQAQEQASKRRR